MTAMHRVLPGLTALVLSFTSGYLSITNLGLLFDAYANPQFFFTVSHIGSALICLAIPCAFLLVGRFTHCRSGLLKLGTVLLSAAALILFIANATYVFILRNPLGADGAIGPGLLLLLGISALFVISLVLTLALPLTRPTDSGRLISQQVRVRN